MRKSMTVLAGTALLALAACGGGADNATSDDNTAVTDVDPGEGDGTIDDTTLIDGTIGAEEEMGMESRMPADAGSEPSRPAPAAEPEESEETEAPEPAPSAPEPAPAETTDEGGDEAE